MVEALFWADQKAEEILKRKKFHYLDKKIPEFKKYVVKTSASISGALHIGRLSDTIRGDSVVMALKAMGASAELIWVAEDMDPLRRIPEGAPETLGEYIGTPVVDVPDPWGCHSSYAEHHIDLYHEVLQQFVSSEIKSYSMSVEYRKGNFKTFIKTMLERIDEVIAIQNKYRDKPLAQGWSPFSPVCKNCGKIITPRVLGSGEGKILYRCEDYAFESQVAKGCGYEGECNPLTDRGKLMWKGEWAAQWARWKVASEGAGKEYVVPQSAWWVNAELVERILDFPMPVPIFYEHLMIDGQKMSASLGNVVYPHEWLEVAPPELLRFFYNKKLMKTRSFSWRDLPRLYDEYDFHARVYFGLVEVENKKEEKNMKRLYESSQVKTVKPPIPLPFSHAIAVSQIFDDEESLLASLRRTGHYEEKTHELIMERVKLARRWAEKYAPEEMKVKLDVDIREIRSKLTEKQRNFIRRFGEWLKSGEWTGELIHEQIYKIGRELNLSAKESFQAVYLVVLGNVKGPRAGTLLASLDRGWVLKRFYDICG
jgi:lysyl-tRNA synthetase class 1